MIPFEFLRNLPDDVKVTLVTFSGPVGLPEEVRERCKAVHILSPRNRKLAFFRSYFGLNGLGKQERYTAKAKEIASRLSVESDATLIHGPHALPLAHHVQGPVVLQVLNMLEDMDLRAMRHNSADYIHVVTEALKLAYADRDTYYADPDFVAVPAEGLLSKAYARERAGRIDSARASKGFVAGDPLPFDRTEPA